MSYIYRMLDKDYKCLYLGYTGRDVSDRLNEHMSYRSHLEKDCIDNIARIDCKYYKNDYDARKSEVRHIKRYDPVYNTVHKRKNKRPMRVFLMENGWETFSCLQEMNEVPRYVKPMQWSMLVMVLLFGIISLVYMLTHMSWTLF